MRAVDIILHKREGAPLGDAEIASFVEAYAGGEVPDYQAAALVMAVFFQGMNPDETLALTRAMRDSGAVLDLSELPGPRVDKHSTGGVGDKTSLVLAPLAAACGAYVPMLSGRGLGHTGGTLDKLESIPGFRVDLDLEEIRNVVAACGLAISGQTQRIAPADRKLCALRDVTATVESLPLIASSIMSRKLAEGIDALVLDVKTGDGALTQSEQAARALARTMQAIGAGMGCRVVALVTDMSQPLGYAVGNALEVSEAIETLKGRGPRDVESLAVELAAWMVQLGGLASSLDAARARVRQALASGQALERLRRNVELQGGDPRVCDRAGVLPRAAHTQPLRAERDGRIAHIDCRAVGRVAMALGAGRERLDSRVDPAAGVVLHKKLGDRVIEGEPLATLHANDATRLAAALDTLGPALRVGAEAPDDVALIRDVLDA